MWFAHNDQYCLIHCVEQKMDIYRINVECESHPRAQAHDSAPSFRAAPRPPPLTQLGPEISFWTGIQPDHTCHIPVEIYRKLHHFVDKIRKCSPAGGEAPPALTQCQLKYTENGTVSQAILFFYNGRRSYPAYYNWHVMGVALPHQSYVSWNMLEMAPFNRKKIKMFSNGRGIPSRFHHMSFKICWKWHHFIGKTRNSLPRERDIERQRKRERERLCVCVGGQILQFSIFLNIFYPVHI